MSFDLSSQFEPRGDQQQAIEQLRRSLEAGNRHQTLLGVTGSGKTFTAANVVAALNKPTLVVSHNKTLAAQLYSEFKQFFPQNAVEYFVSYFDYYQPEAYIPRTDTYIEKDSSINEEIERLRLSPSSSLLSRRDVIVVASVSCIYGLGTPEDYANMVCNVFKGQALSRELFLAKLVDMLYERNDIALTRGKFRVRGDVVEVHPATADEEAIRVEFFGDEIDLITCFDPLTGSPMEALDRFTFFPAKQFVTPYEKMRRALTAIRAELDERIVWFEANQKLLEAQRIKMRTEFDLEMLQEMGFCSGIENYSRHLSGREPGSRPYTLLDFFPKDFFLIVDESHATIPQIGGMYEGDRSRKSTLVEFGFRLPSALDNRPLRFDEFLAKVPEMVFVSATPGPYEQRHSTRVAEQLIRPTGIVDPDVELRPTRNQIDDLLGEIRRREEAGERTLVTTLTKKMAEDLTDYLLESGVKARYLHSEIDTLERIQIVRELRLGEYDVLVGVNLLREGLDLPEVSLVAILDADKEGFLRGRTSLIQTIGRAARNINGKVLMYADKQTEAIKEAIDETTRRRLIQLAYNEEHGILPQTITKGVSDIAELLQLEAPHVPARRRRGSKKVEGMSRE